MNPNFDFAKLAVGAVATVCLYSILYRENKFYRLVEHMFLGLAVGFSVVAIWVETLESSWWNAMLGKAASATGDPAVPAMYLYALLLPVGLMGFMVFSKKHSWISRIPIGIILGAWGGQQFSAFQTEFMPQVKESVRIIVPTSAQFRVPPGLTLSNEAAAEIATAVGVSSQQVQAIAPNVINSPAVLKAQAEANNLTPDQATAITGAVLDLRGNEVYISQAIGNIVYMLTLLSVLAYFLFSFELKSKLTLGFTKMGRMLLMVGFGAIFGSTVMTRFALLIDRMSFIFVEFLYQGVFRR